MKVMTVNFGYDGFRFNLFNMDTEECIASGEVGRLELEDSFYKICFNNEEIVQEVEMVDYVDAVGIILNKLISLDIIKSLDEIDAVGHKIVQGKDIFNKSVIINDSVIEKLDFIKDFPTLNNSANLLGIEAFSKNLPDVLMVAVFDTAFYNSLDEEAFLFPVPYSWYEKHGIRKYGAYGISHNYISLQVKKLLSRDNFRLISCHMGRSCSIAAIEDGKCIDTSMGFTTLGGIMMETRSGDIDPSIIPFVMEKEGKHALEIIDDLDKYSGLLGLSEYSSDMRQILDKCLEGDSRCIVAKNKYVRRIVNYIAQYYVLLGGVDAIVFTAAVGENLDVIRGEICNKLSCLGVEIDSKLNGVCKEITKISTDDSDIDVYVIPANEELMIARETLNLIDR